MLSLHSVKPLATLLASASLLVTMQAHVLAQVEEIPETALITPSRVRGVTLRPPSYPGQYTRLTMMRFDA